LLDTARNAYGVSPGAAIICAPGVQALIQWLPIVFPARHVGVLGFSYREHEACWRASGAQVVRVTTPAELASFDIAVVVNPNNPDGRLCAPAELAEAAGALAQHGGRLIVDEAFMDLQDASLIPDLPASTIVLRSFGKVYGLAGLRLGFAIGSETDCQRLRRALGPWAVSGPAIKIGARALADQAWLAQAGARLRQEAARLDQRLLAAGFAIAGGTPLFRLTRHENAQHWFQRLGQAGILTRPFPEHPDWLRFGIPHGEEQWSRLEQAISPPPIL
jgi:cobalamin biosynthesis protein CobC